MRYKRKYRYHVNCDLHVSYDFLFSKRPTKKQVVEHFKRRIKKGDCTILIDKEENFD